MGVDEVVFDSPYTLTEALIGTTFPLLVGALLILILYGVNAFLDRYSHSLNIDPHDEGVA